MAFFLKAMEKEGTQTDMSDNEKEETNADSLDWSVSGISAVSAMCPDRFHSECQSHSSTTHSPWNSPERNMNNHVASSQAELRQLAGQFIHLQSNLEHISERSFTPVNSPRPQSRTKNAASENRNENLDEGEVSAKVFLNDTPPVKDPGLCAAPSSASSSIVRKLVFEAKANDKLVHTRSTLRELESAREAFDVLKTQRSQHESQAEMKNRTVCKSRLMLDEEFKEINDFLDKVKTSSTNGTSKRLSLEDASGKHLTTVSSKMDLEKDLASKLTAEMEKSNKLEITVAELEKKLLVQNSQIDLLQKANVQKEKLLHDLKSKLSLVTAKWTDNQQELVKQLTASREECERLKLEGLAANEQFKVCQDELSKAVRIASDFRHKLTEEEGIKQDVLNELLSERNCKSKQLVSEQEKLQKLAENNEELRKENIKLTSENHTLIQASSVANKNWAEESNRYQDKVAAVQLEKRQHEERLEELENENKTIESSLHTFYASQMEAILTEKIESLQSNVQLWENNLLRDKQEALAILRSEHEAHLENIRRNLFEDVTSRYERQLLDVTASLSASRREAEALREQLKLESRKSSDALQELQTKPNNFAVGFLHDGDCEARDRQEMIWRQILQRTTSSTSTSKSRRSISMVKNNLREISPRHLRQRSFKKRHIPLEDFSTSEADNVEDEMSRRSLPPPPSSRGGNNGHAKLNEFSNGARPRSANARYTSFRESLEKFAKKEAGSPSPASQGNMDELEASSSALTKDERKTVIKDFVKKYLDQNPEAVLDANLMIGLNKMASRLVDFSFASSVHEEGFVIGPVEPCNGPIGIPVSGRDLQSKVEQRISQ